MTESDLLFDTWAWWEYLHDTEVGARLRVRYIVSGKSRIHTSAISLGEIAAQLAGQGASARVSAACGAIRRMSHIWDVTGDIAQEGGVARAKLRQHASQASLADGIILATAQRAGARIVSNDPAFNGQTGVIRG